MDVMAAIRAVSDWRRTLRIMRGEYARASDRHADDAVAGPAPSDVQRYNAGPLNPTMLNFGSAIAVLFAVAVQIAVIAAVRRGDLDLPTAGMIFVVTIGLASAGLWHLYNLFVVAPARQAQVAMKQRQRPDEPWLLDDAWAQRRVVDRSGSRTAMFLWVWVLAWWVFCAFLWDFDPGQMAASFQGSWLKAGLMLVLAATGVASTAAAIAATFRWLRYGASTLKIDTLPGYLGDRFRGTVNAHVPGNMPLDAEITCEDVTVIWTVTPKGGRRKEYIYKTLWKQRWALEPDRITRTKDGGAIIPIDVALPSDKPGFALDDEGGGIRWVLRIGSHLMAENAGVEQLHLFGPQPFAAEYLVPVYART
jgi:hypothetical protein